jgi:hypothetical protein
MDGRIEVDKSLIEPIYSQTGPSQPIDLGPVAVRYDCKGATHNVTANVTMKFVPDDGLEFVCPLESEDPFFALKSSREVGGVIKLALPERGVDFDAFCVAIGGDRGGIVYVPTRSGITVTPPSASISTATFHLFNFPDFYGAENYILRTGEPPLQGAKTCGRVVLKADGWNITVAATDRTDSLTKALKAQGGYVITHMGRVMREDGSTFSSEQLDDLLTCLHYFLSFVLGRWAGLALPVGFDSEGNRVFEQWGTRRTAEGPWNGSFSWFDAHHGELLSQVFPGFMSLWSSNLWHQPLTHALYWYLAACDRRAGIGVDAGLILAQTALETLAWTYCVLQRKMVSPRAFKRGGLPAADKLRLLTSSLSIPKETPLGLSALHGTSGKKWEDAMDAITAIRNSLVHPDGQTGFPGESYYEAYKLSLWIVDLVLLRLCGHRGKYANRLANNRWAGAVEPVPWAQNDVEPRGAP